jgi:putative endonuclease
MYLGVNEDREGDRTSGSGRYDWGMPWTVYLARCADGSLYTGITTNAERRLAQHNRGKGAAYTRSRLPVRLIYSEAVKDRAHALQREHAIRRLSRREKEELASRWAF